MPIKDTSGLDFYMPLETRTVFLFNAAFFKFKECTIKLVKRKN